MMGQPWLRAIEVVAADVVVAGRLVETAQPHGDQGDVDVDVVVGFGGGGQLGIVACC